MKHHSILTAIIIISCSDAPVIQFETAAKVVLAEVFTEYG